MSVSWAVDSWRGREAALEILSRGPFQKRRSRFLLDSGLEHTALASGRSTLVPTWLSYISTFTFSFTLCSEAPTPPRPRYGSRPCTSLKGQLDDPRAPDLPEFRQQKLFPQTPAPRPPAEPPLRGAQGGRGPRAGPRSGSALPQPTAAPRLRAEPPVGGEVSPSSWRGLTEQSGFVSADSCGDGGPALRWGRVPVRGLDLGG